MPERLECGGRTGDRRHHDDGSPRTTARSTRGRELDWFERNGPCEYVHNWSFDVGTALHDDMKGGGNYKVTRSRITISRREYPSWVLAADTAACLAVATNGGMPVYVKPRY